MGVGRLMWGVAGVHATQQHRRLLGATFLFLRHSSPGIVGGDALMPMSPHAERRPPTRRPHRLLPVHGTGDRR
jgi:hypothetical protein